MSQLIAELPNCRNPNWPSAALAAERPLFMSWPVEPRQPEELADYEGAGLVSQARAGCAREASAASVARS
jgi:hypothetical protein